MNNKAKYNIKLQKAQLKAPAFSLRGFTTENDTPFALPQQVWRPAVRGRPLLPGV